MLEPGTIVVLGASGFVGRAVVAEAVAAGFRVLGLARSDRAAAVIRSLGAQPLLGEVAFPSTWVTQCDGAEAIIDLTQPAVPSRLTVRGIGAMAQQRVAATEGMLEALAVLPASRRPLWVSVNGTDDLLPDAAGFLSGKSALRSTPRGFAHIGLPVRAAIEASGLDATYLYLGQIVYGPGKAYAEVIVDGIRTGRARIIGSGDNVLPLTHVEDAARAITHLVALGRDEVVDRTVVAVPATPATQRDLYAVTAAALGKPTPARVPVLIAALAAGRVNADVMTLDAHCNRDLLTATGFTFRHQTLQGGIAASVAALGR